MSKMNWKKVIGWGVAALVVGTVIYINAQDKTTNAKVKVAMNTPLTGLSAAYHVPWNNGFRMGVRDELRVNNLPEDTFSYDIQDNQ